MEFIRVTVLPVNLKGKPTPELWLLYIKELYYEDEAGLGSKGLGSAPYFPDSSIRLSIS